MGLQRCREGCLEKFQQQLCFALKGGQPGEGKPLSNGYQLPKPQGFSAKPKRPEGRLNLRRSKRNYENEIPIGDDAGFRHGIGAE
jgi:hypothetical protein